MARHPLLTPKRESWPRSRGIEGIKADTRPNEGLQPTAVCDVDRGGKQVVEKLDDTDLLEQSGGCPRLKRDQVIYVAAGRCVARRDRAKHACVQNASMTKLRLVGV
jgi:hypothetical protein